MRETSVLACKARMLGQERRPFRNAASRLILVGVLASVFCASCSGSLGRAKADFKSARYAEANAELTAVEAESATWSLARRAEYALYRGLVHQALGDRAAAGEWLRRAQELERSRPGTLSEDDVVRLQLALDSVGEVVSR